MSSLDIVEPEHLEVSNLFYRDPALYDSVQPDLNARSPGGRPRRAAGTVDRLEAVSVISWRCGPGMVDEPTHRPRHHCRLTPPARGGRPRLRPPAPPHRLILACAGRISAWRSRPRAPVSRGCHSCPIEPA
jgi:hypothetical protein